MSYEKTVKNYKYKKPKRVNKFNTELCNDKMTFQECELAVLRQAMDEAEELHAKSISNNEEVKKMIEILEDFLMRKKCICYGGTAINNILPKHAQFYDQELEIPDYDFYSPNAMDDAKELADLYFEAGFKEIEAKAGMHHGTYKVFVNFIPIADLTYLHPDLFKSIGKEAITVKGIKYAPPNFLRMNMFIELSRPAGDVSRWEKVMKRLTLLNKYYKLDAQNCSQVEFQRKMESYANKSEVLYFTLRDLLIDHDVVFLGGYATRLYSRHMPNHDNEIAKKIPDFDVISDNAESVATMAIDRLKDLGFNKAKVVKHEGFDEIIPPNYEIRVGTETLAFIYEPIACHSYNKIRIKDLDIKVATIDTMLNFYLAFYYSNESYHPKNRIMCMSKFLFDVEAKNRLEQKGLLKRFSIDCIGTQPTLDSIRSEKVKKFKELKDKRNTREYDEWFLKYSYSDGKFIGAKPTEKKEKKDKKTTKNNKTKKKGVNSVINGFKKLFD